MLSIYVVVAVHNAAKTLGPVLAHLERNRIHVHIIDHGSTDRTPQIIAQHKGAPVIKVTHQEFDGVYQWKQLLELKEAVVKNLAVDGGIHVDADARGSGLPPRLSTWASAIDLQRH
jgi:hypothetical protein